MPTILRKHAIVSGRVQGVGFRNFTQYQASKLHVEGWVRNVGYDQVEIEAQAPETVLNEFFRFIQMGPTHSRVDNIQIADLEISSEYQGFQIRHSR